MGSKQEFANDFASNAKRDIGKDFVGLVGKVEIENIAVDEAKVGGMGKSNGEIVVQSIIRLHSDNLAGCGKKAVGDDAGTRADFQD